MVPNLHVPEKIQDWIQTCKDENEIFERHCNEMRNALQSYIDQTKHFIDKLRENQKVHLYHNPLSQPSQAVKLLLDLAEV